jgi:hypothetical protein
MEFMSESWGTLPMRPLFNAASIADANVCGSEAKLIAFL